MCLNVLEFGFESFENHTKDSQSRILLYKTKDKSHLDRQQAMVSCFLLVTKLVYFEPAVALIDSLIMATRFVNR